MPDMAGLLGIPVEFTFADRTYKVHPRTLELEGRLGHMLADEALASIRAHADKLGPDLLALQLEGWRHDLAARLFSYDGYIVQRALGTPDGQKLLAFLQLGKANPGISRGLIDQIWKDQTKREELWARMKQASGEADPNPSSEDSKSESQDNPAGASPTSSAAGGD
jgi:hypothetical protein